MLVREFWPDVDCESLLPPNKRNHIGRLKKSRRREPSEPFTPRTKGYVHRCENCGSIKHNRKSCKRKFAQPSNNDKQKICVVFHLLFMHLFS